MPRFTIQKNRISHALCTNCRHGHVVRRSNGKVFAICREGMSNTVIPADVEDCTAFDDKRVIAEWELEKIAWTLRTDRSGLAIGFAPPKREET